MLTKTRSVCVSRYFIAGLSTATRMYVYKAFRPPKYRTKNTTNTHKHIQDNQIDFYFTFGKTLNYIWPSSAVVCRKKKPNTFPASSFPCAQSTRMVVANPFFLLFSIVCVCKIYFTNHSLVYLNTHTPLVLG